MAKSRKPGKPISPSGESLKSGKKISAELTEDELKKVSGGSQSTGAGAGKITINPF